MSSHPLSIRSPKTTPQTNPIYSPGTIRTTGPVSIEYVVPRLLKKPRVHVHHPRVQGAGRLASRLVSGAKMASSSRRLTVSSSASISTFPTVARRPSRICHFGSIANCRSSLSPKISTSTSSSQPTLMTTTPTQRRFDALIEAAAPDLSVRSIQCVSTANAVLKHPYSALVHPGESVALNGTTNVCATFALPTDSTDLNHTGMLVQFSNGIRFYNTGDTAWAERLAALLPRMSISAPFASTGASTISAPTRLHKSSKRFVHASSCPATTTLW